MRSINKGFTLMELMVVMVILGILATLGVASFQSSQKKGRDAQRKLALRQVALALEAYYNDYAAYPASNGSGEIMGCGPSSTPTACPWGSTTQPFKHTTGPTYMVQLPNEISGSLRYVYTRLSGSQFKLYAKLENVYDTDQGVSQVGYSGTNCAKSGTAVVCTYAVTSPNVVP